MVLPVETSHTCGWRLARVRGRLLRSPALGGSCTYPAGPLPQPLPSLSFLGKSPSQLLPLFFQIRSQEGWPQKESWAATPEMPRMGTKAGCSQPPLRRKTNRHLENCVSRSTQRHLLSHFENQKMQAPPWSLSRGFICLEGVPGKWSEVAGGGVVAVGRNLLQMPPPLGPPLESPGPSPDPSPAPGPCWGKLSHGKRPQSQTKHPSVPRLCRRRLDQRAGCAQS